MLKALQTPQELAAWCLAQPEATDFFSKAEKRFLFSLESWPETLPIRPRDKLRLLKLYHRFREALGL